MNKGTRPHLFSERPFHLHSWWTLRPISHGTTSQKKRRNRPLTCREQKTPPLKIPPERAHG